MEVYETNLFYQYLQDVELLRSLICFKLEQSVEHSSTVQNTAVQCRFWFSKAKAEDTLQELLSTDSSLLLPWQGCSDNMW